MASMFGNNSRGESKEFEDGSISAETFIGPSVKLEGNFAAEGNVVIEGMLTGNVSTAGDIRVGPQASIEAQVKATNATIAGKVKGNITITGVLVIAGSAVILGDIKAASLSVEEGALLNGKISMGKERAGRNNGHENAEEKARHENQEEEEALS